MKIAFKISTSGYWWDGNIHSAIPGQPVEIDDGDSKAVAWARHSVASGAAELLEDVKPKAEPAAARAAARPAQATAKAEPKKPPSR
ncbi:MAG TPA: hypothetical protein VIV12_04250 [Streptosporangiaceae bacterium]